MLEKHDGKLCLILDEKVRGCFVVTYGDTDNDGENGIRARGFVDIPFDGDDLPDPVFDSGEIEQIPTALLPERIGEALKWLGGVSEGVMNFAKKFIGQE
jgi:hypothetical protein